MKAVLIPLVLGASLSVAKPVSKAEIISRIMYSSLKSGVDPYLALAIAQPESNFDPRARREEEELGTASIGLFQILLTTARAEFGFKGGEKELAEPRNNIWAGIKYIKHCLVSHGETNLAMACCYQAGFYSDLNWCERSPQIQEYAADISTKREAWRLHFLESNVASLE